MTLSPRLQRISARGGGDGIQQVLAPAADLGAKLPPHEHYAAVELFRGNMLRHNLIVYRDDGPDASKLPRFDEDAWLSYTPIRLPGTVVVRDRLPPGAAAVLINQEHADTDLYLAVDATELRLVEGIDGQRTIAAIIARAAGRTAPTSRLHRQARSLFERLWQWDQVVFAAANIQAR